MSIKYDNDLAFGICERLENEPQLGLSEICRQAGVLRQTFHDWRKPHPELEERYKEAKLNGFHELAQQCITISDTPVEGVEEKYEPVVIPNDNEDEPPLTEFKLVERKVGDMLGHRKLQIETRMKLLSKWFPEKYGDKLGLEHSGAANFTLTVNRKHKPAD